MTKFKSYGNAILDLWTAKSSSEREALLLEVDPTMYQYRWEGGQYQVECQWGDIGSGMRNFKNFKILPYINLEALREAPAHFLNLVFNRVKCPAEGWAPYNTHKLRLPWDSGAFGILFNRNCVVAQGSKYGEHHRASTQRRSLLPALQMRYIHKGGNRRGCRSGIEYIYSHWLCQINVY
jgi:hypothetical protein